MLQAIISGSDPKRFVHKVVSLTSLGSVGTQLREDGVEVVALGLPSIRAAARHLSNARKLMARADVVHTWMYHANLVGSLLARSRTPLLWSIHATYLERKYTKTTTRLAVWCGKLLSASLPDKTIFCSYSSQKFHSDIGYNVSKSAVIENGIDTERFQRLPEARETFRRAHGFHGRFLIGSTARWHPQKDHTTLLKAFELALRGNRTLHLVLAGEGITRQNQALNTLLSDLQITDKVLLLGAVKDIRPVLSALDLFVISSAYGEALPLALCEAMACEVPAVATDIGDCAEIVSDCGWVTSPGGFEEMADAITSAAQQSEESRVTMGQRGRGRIASHYDLLDSILRYEQAYDELHSDLLRRSTRSVSTSLGSLG